MWTVGLGAEVGAAVGLWARVGEGRLHRVLQAKTSKWGVYKSAVKRIAGAPVCMQVCVGVCTCLLPCQHVCCLPAHA